MRPALHPLLRTFANQSAQPGVRHTLPACVFEAAKEDADAMTRRDVQQHCQAQEEAALPACLTERARLTAHLNCCGPMHQPH